MRACLSVWEGDREREGIAVRWCMCVFSRMVLASECVCVCENELERERERERLEFSSVS